MEASPWVPGIARGGRTPASAGADPRRGAATSGRPARGRASRSRARADASPASAAAGRRPRRRAGSTWSRAGLSWDPVENVPRPRVRTRQAEGRLAAPGAVDEQPVRARLAGDGDRAVILEEALRLLHAR